MANSNNAPKIQWHRTELSCGTVRRRLYVNGAETPFFVDSNPLLGHRTMGEPHGLYGAGMSEPGRLSGKRHALVLGCAKTITPLKHRAEQMAMGD